MSPIASLALLSLSILSPAVAQQDGETIWGATIITNFGDRIPLLSPQNSELTALGAQQMNSLGSAFRNRYIDNVASTDGSANHTIRGIAHDGIDNLQTSVTTMYDIYIQQSTQAFLQGLYPPFGSSNNNSGSSSNDSAAGGNILVNNTRIYAPLSGMQYPQMYIASPVDQNYVYLNASYNCPSFLKSYRELLSSSDNAAKATGAMSGAIPNSSLNLDNAYAIWDYLSYGQIHSQDVASRINDDIIANVRAIASDLIYRVYGNTSARSAVRAVNGAGLASFTALNFNANLQTNATQNKLNIASTGDESLVSLFAMIGLPDLYEQFTSLPERGSAVTFELYSSSPVSPSSDEAPYPNPEDIYVRFLFQNGTSGTLSSFPYLGRTKADPDPTMREFFQEIANRARLVTSPSTWCDTCGDSAIWCPAYDYNGFGGSGITTGGNGGHIHGMSATIGGVIGAMVTLAVVGLVTIAAMLLSGLRFTRTGKGPLAGRFGGRHGAPRSTGGKTLGGAWFGRNTTHKRQSSGLGGFKGGEKLASDVDLPKGGGGGFGATVVPVEGSGHKRVESWELREGRGRLDDQDGAIAAVESREHV
jgi:hypothetical protein